MNKRQRKKSEKGTLEHNKATKNFLKNLSEIRAANHWVERP